MTNKEREEALSIIKQYNVINDKLERTLSSIQKLEKKNEETLLQLEKIKQKEKRFIDDYTKKYGERNILFDINSVLTEK